MEIMDNVPQQQLHTLRLRKIKKMSRIFKCTMLISTSEYKNNSCDRSFFCNGLVIVHIQTSESLPLINKLTARPD